RQNRRICPPYGRILVELSRAQFGCVQTAGPPQTSMTAHPGTGTRAVPIISNATEPVAASPHAEAFYAEVLRELKRSNLPVLLAGTYAVSVYTGISRPTKDLDSLRRAGDCPRRLTPSPN